MQSPRLLFDLEHREGEIFLNVRRDAFFNGGLVVEIYNRFFPIYPG